MTVDITPGNYRCIRGSSGVVVGKTDKDSIESMMQVYNTAKVVRDACNSLRSSPCPPDCPMAQLIEKVTANGNELLK